MVLGRLTPCFFSKLVDITKPQVTATLMVVIMINGGILGYHIFRQTCVDRDPMAGCIPQKHMAIGQNPGT